MPGTPKSSDRARMESDNLIVHLGSNLLWLPRTTTYACRYLLPSSSPALVSWFWRVIITLLTWIGVRQTECSLVIRDRCIVRVAAPVPK